MADLVTMLWKEIAEFGGNRRFLRTFGIAVLLFGILPTLEHSKVHRIAAPQLTVLSLIYMLISGVILVAQTAPDLVLHERVGRTLDYLISTRLPDAAIFAGKVLTGAAVGYLSTMATVAVQLVASNLVGGGHWSWEYLGSGQGRLLAFAAPAAIAVYLATIGTFVALRVGDQRSAYMVTMLGVAVLALPFVLGLVHLHFTVAWLGGAIIVLAALAAVLVAVGTALFKREMLVLYLQE